MICDTWIPSSNFIFSRLVTVVLLQTTWPTERQIVRLSTRLNLVSLTDWPESTSDKQKRTAKYILNSERKNKKTFFFPYNKDKILKTILTKTGIKTITFYRAEKKKKNIWILSFIYLPIIRRCKK